MSLKIQNGKVIYNWSDFDQDIVELYNKIKENKKLQYVCGIPRGGLVPAVKLSHF